MTMKISLIIVIIIQISRKNNFHDPKLDINGTGYKRDRAYRMAGYHKMSAKSDEMSFQPHRLQEPLVNTEVHSLIEEENKSRSNHNLSTSSRSYRPPNVTRIKSMHAEMGNSMLGASVNTFYPPNQTSTALPQNQRHYMFNGATMDMNPMMNPIPSAPQSMVQPAIQQTVQPTMSPMPGQYNYSVNLHAKPPGFEAQAMNRLNAVGQPGQVPSRLSPSPIHQGTSGSPQNATGSKGLTANITNTSTSSKVTSNNSTSAHTDIQITTGQLKFFNQQHQYGFIVSDIDTIDVFFHYDDVKHTLLSKGNI